MEQVRGSIKNITYHGSISHFTLHTYPFHLQGGGQPNDKIFTQNNHEIKIIKNVDGITLEVEEIITGDCIEIMIDSNFKNLCAKLHTAGHLIGMHLAKTYNLVAIKGHHFPNESYIKFEGEFKGNAQTLQVELARHIGSSYVVTIFLKNNVRTMQIAGMGSYPCGGTHVGNIAEIKKLNIDKITVKRGNTTIKYSVE